MNDIKEENEIEIALNAKKSKINSFRESLNNHKFFGKLLPEINTVYRAIFTDLDDRLSLANGYLIDFDYNITMTYLESANKISRNYSAISTIPIGKEVLVKIVNISSGSLETLLPINNSSSTNRSISTVIQVSRKQINKEIRPVLVEDIKKIKTYITKMYVDEILNEHFEEFWADMLHLNIANYYNDVSSIISNYFKYDDVLCNNIYYNFPSFIDYYIENYVEPKKYCCKFINLIKDGLDVKSSKLNIKLNSLSLSTIKEVVKNAKKSVPIDIKYEVKKNGANFVACGKKLNIQQMNNFKDSLKKECDILNVKIEFI
jgi:hypothetical protein